jgi:hypothetical protein
MRNGLARFYDILTPDERFRLLVQAEARGDAVEARRLVETCPRRTYSQRDDAFARRWDTMGYLTMALYGDLRPLALLLCFLEVLGDLARGGVWGLLGVPRPADADGEDAVPGWFLALLDGLRRQVARKARGVWDGFATACREDLGLEPETALGATEQGRYLLERMAEHRELLERVEADPAKVADYREAVGKVWRRFAVGDAQR